MTRARANSTNAAKLRWLEGMRRPSEYPKFEPVPKAPGSKVLQLGKWVEITKETT